ncbi:MAG: glycosyltransferase family 1 protein [Patescibacteria group bacterium]
MFTFGIDANALTRPSRTGTERYVSSLLREMMKFPLQQDEEVILYSSGPIDEFRQLPAGWSLRVLNWPPKKVWTHARLSWELIRRTPNVFFTPAHEIPRFYRRTKIVSTVHDVAFCIVPEVYSETSRRRQEWAVKRAIREADHLITVSNTTKQDLESIYHVPSSKITATQLAIEPDDFQVSEEKKRFVLQKYRLSRKKYFITIGRVEQKKNVLMLIDAFSEFKRSRPSDDPIELVFGGSVGFGEDVIMAKINASAVKESIKLLGYIPEEDLAGLVSGALAYVFPAHYEGFGIPALEAMAAEVPLIASDIPALREVAGEAAIFASPQSIGQWAGAMKKISDQEVDIDELVERGRERVGQFSWEKTAQKTWEVLRSLK